jgi:hypothetical protein
MISRDSNLRRNKILIAKNLYLTKRIKKKKTQHIAYCYLESLHQCVGRKIRKEDFWLLTHKKHEIQIKLCLSRKIVLKTKTK